MKTGADHDRGLPRLARDRARQPARLLQPALRQAARRSCPATCAARCRDGSRRRAASARRSTSTALPAILDDFRAEGVEAIAICLLHSYADPAHEQAVLARVRELWPEVSVVASHQITPRVARVRAHEHGRALGLRAAGRRALPDAGSPTASEARASAGQLYIMQSNCGVDSVEKTKRDPDHDGRVGPCERLLGRRRARPADRRAERARARHRRARRRSAR